MDIFTTRTQREIVHRSVETSVGCPGVQWTTYVYIMTWGCQRTIAQLTVPFREALYDFETAVRSSTLECSNPKTIFRHQQGRTPVDKEQSDFFVLTIWGYCSGQENEEYAKRQGLKTYLHIA